MTPIETADAILRELVASCDAVDASLQNFHGDDDEAVQERHRVAWQRAKEYVTGSAAPVVQVVEPLTEAEVMPAIRASKAWHLTYDSGPYEITKLTLHGKSLADGIAQACARKWGLTLKENT